MESSDRSWLQNANASERPVPAGRRRTIMVTPSGAVVWMLALASGSTDAFCLLHLGGVFASVITGNLVVLAASAVQGLVGPAVGAIAAVGAYALGVFVGSRLVALRRFAPRSVGALNPAAVTTCLVLETILLLGFFIGWFAIEQRPGGASRPALLVLGGAAMGLQSIAVSALGRPGLSTTYLTGALTRIVSTVGEPGWWRRLDWVQIFALVGVILGAACETVLLRYLPWIGPLPGAVLAAAGALNVGLRLRAAPDR
jgi:uncharacterized membrane protein YoaK (UPF0700 family)